MTGIETDLAQVWQNTINLPDLLVSLGEELGREGLLDTPRRVRNAWEEILCGYTMNPEDILKTDFDSAGGGVIAVRDIDFTSMCEHHMLPFTGKAHVGYEAKFEDRVCGLSKVTRLVQCFASRLQIQERLMNQIADALDTYLHPTGILVCIDSEHMCCRSRGIKQHRQHMVTSCSRGVVSPFLMSQVFGK